MVGGLVMGALEKLYRQPFAYAVLTAYEASASPVQKGCKKVPPHVTVGIVQLRLSYTALQVVHRPHPIQGLQPPTPVSRTTAIFPSLHFVNGFCQYERVSR